MAQKKVAPRIPWAALSFFFRIQKANISKLGMALRLIQAPIRSWASRVLILYAHGPSIKK